MLEQVEKKLGTDVKVSLGDYIRLVQLQKELEEDELREIKVTWVEPEGPTEETPPKSRRWRKSPRHPGNSDSVQAAAGAETISRFEGAVQGVFWSDWIGEEPGFVPGGDSPELSESWTYRIDRGPNVSDAAGRDGSGFTGDAGTE